MGRGRNDAREPLARDVDGQALARKSVHARAGGLLSPMGSI